MKHPDNIFISFCESDLILKSGAMSPKKHKEDDIAVQRIGLFCNSGNFTSVTVYRNCLELIV